MFAEALAGSAPWVRGPVVLVRQILTVSPKKAPFLHLWQPLPGKRENMVSPQFVAETLVALERLGAQPTLNIYDGTISLAGRLPPLAAGAPRLEASALAGAAGAALRGRSATIDEASEDGSTAALGSRASEIDDSEALADDAVYDVFVSHCKRLDASEDRAVWVADVCEGAGLKVFFDRSDLTDISTEVLERSVKQSRVLVTVLDPYTFESVWCVRENRWAAAAGRPIVFQ